MPQHAGPPKRPWWRRWWIASIAALAVGIGIGAAGASGKTTTKEVAGPTVYATTTATATATAQVTTTPTKVIATHTRVVTKTYTPPVKVAFADGTYLVGKEIQPGTYHTDGVGDGSGCYWEREANGNGGLDSIIANDNIDGPTTIQINASDYAFKSNGGCDWTKVG